jgi:hypothetical protein
MQQNTGDVWSRPERGCNSCDTCNNYADTAASEGLLKCRRCSSDIITNGGLGVITEAVELAHFDLALFMFSPDSTTHRLAVPPKQLLCCPRFQHCSAKPACQPAPRCDPNKSAANNHNTPVVSCKHRSPLAATRHVQCNLPVCGASMIS